MAMENDLRNYLLQDNLVQSLLNGNIGYGKRPAANPDAPISDDYIEANYFRVSNPKYRYFKNHNRPNFQISIWSKKLSRARLAANAIQDRLFGFNGQMGDTTVYTTLVDSDRELFDNEADIWHIDIETRFVYK